MEVLCPMCKGTGFILIERKGDESGGHLETCPTCGGSGRVGK
jgi:DnaJ-class molecular chaperone